MCKMHSASGSAPSPTRCNPSPMRTKHKPDTGLEDQPAEIIPAAEASLDQNGLIRVGGQPVPLRPLILSLPSTKVDSTLVRKLQRLFQDVDVKLGTFEVDWLDDHLDDVNQSLYESLTWDRDRTNAWAVCEYSGLDLSWAPGPRSWSVEAVYPLVSNGGQLGYHLLPNVHIVSSTLNLAKGRRPILVLPLLAEWQRALSYPHPPRRKALCLWVYNAMSNICLAGALFGATLTHQAQIARWKSWDESTRKNVLELLRTGTKNQAYTDALTGMTLWDAMPFDI
ncbi:hypothetical protein ACJZ2D_007919 [Fusarium nematophilum]